MSVPFLQQYVGNFDLIVCFTWPGLRVRCHSCSFCTCLGPQTTDRYVHLTPSPPRARTQTTTPLTTGTRHPICVCRYYTQSAPVNCGLAHPSIAPYRAFVCSDGKEVLLSIQNEREWKRLCDQVTIDPINPINRGAITL